MTKPRRLLSRLGWSTGKQHPSTKEKASPTTSMIELLDSKEDDSINKAASAKLNAAVGTEPELNKAKDD
jgi:hypothetical protein